VQIAVGDPMCVQVVRALADVASGAMADAPSNEE